MLLAALSVTLPDDTWLHASQHRQAVHQRIPERLPVLVSGLLAVIGCSVQSIRDWSALVAQQRLKHFALQLVVALA